MPPVAPRSALAGTDAAVGFMWGASITACLVLVAVCLRLTVVFSRRGKKREMLSRQKKKRLESTTTNTPAARSHESRLRDTSRPHDRPPLYEKIRLHNKRKLHQSITLQQQRSPRKLLALPGLLRPLRQDTQAAEPQQVYPNMQHASAGLQTRMAPMPRAGSTTAARNAWWRPFFKERRASSFVSYDVLHKPLSRSSTIRSVKKLFAREPPRAPPLPTPYVVNKHPGHFFGQYHITPLHVPYLPTQATPPERTEDSRPKRPSTSTQWPQSQTQVVPAHNMAPEPASLPGPAVDRQEARGGFPSPKYPATASSRYSTIADLDRASRASSMNACIPSPLRPLHAHSHSMPFAELPWSTPAQTHRSLPMSPPPTRALPHLPSPPLSPYPNSDDECGGSLYTSVRTSSVFSLESADPARHGYHLAPPAPSMSKAGKLPDSGLQIWMEEAVGH